MTTLRQLEVLAAVVRSGSVTEAAARLYVSQPSVSDTLGALERHLGVALFTGRGRRRRLTAAGEVFWDHARRALSLIASGEQAVADLGEEVRGKLSLLAVTTAGEQMVPSVLHGFLTAHPEVEVSLQVTNRAEARIPLIEGTVDLAVMGRPPEGLALQSLPFMENRLLLVCVPTHPAATGLANREDWEKVTLLLREEGSGTRAAVEELGLRPHSIMVLGSNAAILAVLKEGLGVGVLPELAVSAELAAGVLVEVPAPGFPLRRQWHVVWPAGRRLTKPAAAFLEALVEYGKEGRGKRATGGVPPGR
jgi:DNA-binding transcriptional LysR family regulator